MRMRTGVAAFMCFLAIGASELAAKQHSDSTEKWIRNLGSDDFKTREAAEAALKKMGPKILPRLRPLLKSNDVEVATRAGRIVIRLQVLEWIGARGPVNYTEQQLADLELKFKEQQKQRVLQRAGMVAVGLTVEKATVQQRGRFRFRLTIKNDSSKPLILPRDGMLRVMFGYWQVRSVQAPRGAAGPVGIAVSPPPRGTIASGAAKTFKIDVNLSACRFFWKGPRGGEGPDNVVPRPASPRNVLPVGKHQARVFYYPDPEIDYPMSAPGRLVTNEVPMTLTATPASPAGLDALLADLGDDDFKTREAAGEAIKKRGMAALPKLRLLLKSNDVEVATRAGRIIAYIRKNYGRILGKPVVFGKPVNGLQVGLVPLGGVSEAWKHGKGMFICPKCSIKADRTLGRPCPHCEGGETIGGNQKMCRFCAAARRVCQVCGTAKPWCATFVDDKPMHFEVHIKNAGDRLLRFRHYGAFGFRFKVTGADGKCWDARSLGLNLRAGHRGEMLSLNSAGHRVWLAGPIKLLPWRGKNGYTFIQGAGGVWFAVKRGSGFNRKKIPILNTLPPGKYTILVMNHKQLVSAPVEIKIKPGAATVTPENLTFAAQTSGQATAPSAFEMGVPVSVATSFTNGATAAVMLKQRPAIGELIYVLTTPGGRRVEIDPVAELVRSMKSKYSGTTGPGPAPAENKRDFRILDPGKMRGLPAWVGLTGKDGKIGINNRLSMEPLPRKLYAEPGLYELSVTYQNRDPRGWRGKLVSEPVRFEVLSEAKLAAMEKGLALTRRQAAKAALAAARVFFKNDPERLANLAVSKPLRLQAWPNQPKYWSVTYVGDNGLAAQRIAITVDGTTGKTTVRPTGRGA